MTLMSFCRYALTPLLVLCVLLVFSFGLASTQALPPTSTPTPTRQATATRTPTPRPTATRTPLPPTPTEIPCVPSIEYRGTVWTYDGAVIYLTNTTGQPVYLRGVTLGPYPEVVLLDVVANGATLWSGNVGGSVFNASSTLVGWQPSPPLPVDFTVTIGYPIVSPISDYQGGLTFSCSLYGTDTVTRFLTIPYVDPSAPQFDPLAEG